MADRVNMGERGRTGLVAWSGQVAEAYTSKLFWPGAYAIYDEMRRRDPTIRSIVNALVLLARTASWYFEVGGKKTDGDERAAEFMETCLEDMSLPLDDAVEDALTCVWFGWAWQEICYKRREGPNGRIASKETDGRIGWRKWAPRRQSSFARWEFDESGGVQAMVQRPAPNYDEIALPIEKGLHYRGQRDADNPEGWALGESCYEPWYYLKNLHIISGIGWQRSFVGLPVFEFQGRPDDDDKAIVQEVGEALSVDAKQYVSVPESVKFRLESAANSGAAGLLEQMKYERRMMFQTLLADFLDLGTGQTGSWALGSDKSLLFLMAVDGLLDRMARVVNQYGVPRLMGYNAGAFRGMTGMPSLAHKKVEKPALTQLGSWLQQVQGLLSWGAEDETWLRHRAGMPTVEVQEGRAGARRSQEEGALPMHPTEEGALPREEAMMAELQEGEWEQAVEAGEEELRRAAEDALSGQKRRVLAAVREGRAAEAATMNVGVADDEAFWEAEEAALAGVFLPVLAAIVNRVGALRAEELGLDWTGPSAEAMAWVREYTFELVTNLNGATQAVLRRAMEGWLQAGGDIGDLARMLETTFGPGRALLIAQTEATRAAAEGSRAIGGAIGVVYAFTPPAHPRCRCRIVERMLPDGSWVGVWMTANDEKVSVAPLMTPWGIVGGDRALEGVIVSEGEWLGKRFDEVAAGM